MRHKLNNLLVIAVCLAANSLNAATPASITVTTSTSQNIAAASDAAVINPITLSNQMMITVMERIKNGDYAEAKKVAQDMVFGCEKLVDTPTSETRSFLNVMEKKLYERQLKKLGRNNVVVTWTQQPIADGYYLQAIISFQEGKPQEALDLLKKAIYWDPVRAAFHIERGFMLHYQNPPAESVEILVTYLKALELADNPVDFAAALRGIGYLFVDRGNLRAGLACYLLSRKFDPEDKTAIKQIEYIRTHAPDLVESMDETKAAAILKEEHIPVAYDPVHVEIRLEVAEELRSAGNLKECKAVLNEALRLDPNNAEVIRKLAALK